VLDLLGRRDGQVKVRGFRVELAEVEATICAFPGVREAAVLTQEDATNGQRLIAFVASQEGESLRLDVLRRFLRERLPRPMIPARFQRVDSLPRTVSGKVERQSLTDFVPDEAETSEGHVRPRDDLEEQLAAIWEELLQVRPIGITDDFFDLGGHSLLVVRLVAQIEVRFGRTLVLSDLLKGATIEELAATLREPVRTRQGSGPVHLGGSETGQPLALVHPIGGGVLCYRDLAHCLDGKHAVIGLQAAGHEGDAQPETDLVNMASRHLETLRAAHIEEPYVLGGWSMGGVVAFEMARQLVEAGHTAPLVCLVDSSVPAPRPATDHPDERESVMAFAADLARTADSGAASSPNGEIDQSTLEQQLGSDRFKQLLSVYQANQRALDKYHPGFYPGRLVLVLAELSRGRFDDDPARGWNALAGGGVTTYRIPCDHYQIMQRPAVERVAEILSKELGRLEIAGGTQAS
jgi:thioesterase domain-containing protein